MSYKYSNTDSTKNRSLYMYCTYEGMSFLNSYEKSRKLAIKSAYLNFAKKNKLVEKNIFKNLKNKIEQDKILENFTKLIIIKLNYLKKNINKNSLNVIVNYLDNIFVKNQLKDKEKKNNLNFIIKSYEIKKELHLFNTNVNIEQELYVDFTESYHLMFGLLLIKSSINGTNVYKCFNTLLKLNDLMIYKMYNSQFLNHNFLFYSLILENYIFNIIKKEKMGN